MTSNQQIEFVRQLYASVQRGRRRERLTRLVVAGVMVIVAVGLVVLLMLSEHA